MGCPREPSQPGEHEELQKQSERRGEGEGAPGEGQRRRLRARPTSLGRACACVRPVPLARSGTPTKPERSPFLWGGDFRNPKSGSAQQLEPGLEAARCAGGSRLFFWGDKMAGPGKQRKLGPGPGSGVCSSRVRPGSCVGVTGRPAPACTLPARGKHKPSLREPAVPAAHLPPRGLRAGGGRGRWEHGGGREAGRRGGGRRARAGGGGGGGERGWAGGATSRLLWLARYIRSRPPAALPTLLAPRQRSFGTVQSSETRCAPTERTWGKRS